MHIWPSTLTKFQTCFLEWQVFGKLLLPRAFFGLFAMINAQHELAVLGFCSFLLLHFKSSASGLYSVVVYVDFLGFILFSLVMSQWQPDLCIVIQVYMSCASGQGTALRFSVLELYSISML
jgi:hypothetical protein